MPPLEPGDEDYLSMLWDAGPALQGFNGWMPLTWEALRAWRIETGELLSVPEKRLILQLSAIYASAAQGASDPDATSEWLETDMDHKIDQVKAAEQGLALIFRSMTAKSTTNP